MSESLWVALLSLAGTGLGSVAGILASNRLAEFRLQKLEEKVEQHNRLAERTILLEGRMGQVERLLSAGKREE